MNVKLITLNRTTDWSRLWQPGCDLFAVGCERSTPVGYVTPGEMDSLPVPGAPMTIYYRTASVRRVRFKSTVVVSFDPKTMHVNTQAAEYGLTVLQNAESIQ